ncbi:hypothetical protein CUJ83_12645 [Methanocella sp. CWC-04]|uniref:Uncharacterized protein n=1 Tax=Methanooceanicella nereidis TaxID=2052831 RepID=A0AAP2W830_9EURY|nr:hypothetical protein [Methanocella sp. CWC-04]MCD1295844.1 hypothetical protein [Methanocella sp. CWC-04]
MLTEEKYVKAIKAGIICGAALIFLTIINSLIVNVVGGTDFNDDAISWADNYTSNENITMSMPEPSAGNTALLSVVYLLFMSLTLIVFLISGMLSVKFAAEYINTKSDAAGIGAFSAVVAEIIHRPVAIIVDMALSLFSSFNIVSVDAILSTMIGHVICCFPVTLLPGMILAVIGAIAYKIMKLDREE